MNLRFRSGTPFLLRSGGLTPCRVCGAAGSSLINLLAVIATLGVLAAALVPDDANTNTNSLAAAAPPPLNMAGGILAVRLRMKKPDNAGSAKFAVCDFGAVPDDAQGDGDAIRKCIAAAQATGEPAEVVFGAGTYRVGPAPAANGELVSLPVREARDLTLRGAKGGATMLVFTNVAQIRRRRGQ